MGENTADCRLLGSAWLAPLSRVGSALSARQKPAPTAEQVRSQLSAICNGSGSGGGTSGSTGKAERAARGHSPRDTERPVRSAWHRVQYHHTCRHGATTAAGHWPNLARLWAHWERRQMVSSTGRFIRGVTAWSFHRDLCAHLMMLTGAVKRVRIVGARPTGSAETWLTDSQLDRHGSHIDMGIGAR